MLFSCRTSFGIVVPSWVERDAFVSIVPRISIVPSVAIACVPKILILSNAS